MAKTLENIVLVGPMGSGKTTVGRRLADELNRKFFDSDHEIIDKTGVKIEHIFDIEGENGFRDRESKVLSDLYQKKGVVIATGGGIVLKPENRRLLQQSGIVVQLMKTSKQRYLIVATTFYSQALKQCHHPLQSQNLFSDRDH